MPPIQRSPIVLVDCMNLLWRSHFAFKGLRASDGTPTGALYGALKAILKLREHFNTDRIIFCWDHGVPGDPTAPSWRRELFPRYKSGRGRDPEDLLQVKQQRVLLHQVVTRILGYGSAGIPGHEADDVIGILAGNHACAPVHIYGESVVYIYSNDRDLYQLATADKVVLCQTVKGELVVRTQAAIEKEYGFPISRWAAYLALGGDSSDGIHVLPGCGPAMAGRLINMGVLPDQSFEDNPTEVRDYLLRKIPDVKTLWKEVQVVYKLTSLPTSAMTIMAAGRKKTRWLTPVNLISSGYPGKSPASPGWNRLHKFTSFCADLDLSDFISRRQEFVCAASQNGY